MSLSSLGSVALIGAGKMGLALARGWIAGGLSPSALTLVEPQASEAALAFASEREIAITPALSGEAPDVIVLAVKPQVLPDVCRALQSQVGPKTLVLSIAAGIPLATLASLLQTDRVVRAMPNTPAQVGKGVSGAVAGSGAAEPDRSLANELLQAAGQVVWFDNEAMIDAVTAVSGSGPAYVFLLVEALAQAGERQGLDAEQAMLLARQTVIGAAALLETDPAPAATLRKNVTSPKGTTAAALDVLMASNGLAGLLDEAAVMAARRRSEQLGRG